MNPEDFPKVIYDDTETDRVCVSIRKDLLTRDTYVSDYVQIIDFFLKDSDRTSMIHIYDSILDIPDGVLRGEIISSVNFFVSNIFISKLEKKFTRLSLLGDMVIRLRALGAKKQVRIVSFDYK